MYLILSIYFYIIQKNLPKMSHNVPAVYDVFASPNKGFAKQSPGLAKCGGEKPHKGR
jgi:hypothetical protein